MKMRDKKGFTLIEVVIAMCVGGIVLLALVGLAIQQISFMEIARTKTIALNHANAILEEMRDRSETSLDFITSEDWEAWANINGCDTLGDAASSEIMNVLYSNMPEERKISEQSYGFLGTTIVNKQYDNTHNTIYTNPEPVDPLQITVMVNWSIKNRQLSVQLSTVMTTR